MWFFLFLYHKTGIIQRASGSRGFCTTESPPSMPFGKAPGKAVIIGSIKRERDYHYLLPDFWEQVERQGNRHIQICFQWICFGASKIPLIIFTPCLPPLAGKINFSYLSNRLTNANPWLQSKILQQVVSYSLHWILPGRFSDFHSWPNILTSKLII